MASDTAGRAVATFLVAVLAGTYAWFRADGGLWFVGAGGALPGTGLSVDAAWVQGPGGMAAAALVLAAAVYALLPALRAGRSPATRVVAGASLVLGAVAIIVGDDGSAQVLVAGSVGSVVAAWLLDLGRGVVARPRDRPR